MSVYSSQVEGDQEQMLIVQAFCCLHGFLFLSENKFDTILKTFMLHSLFVLISSFFRQLVNSMLCASTLPFFSPFPIYRTVYLLLQCFVVLSFMRLIPYNSVVTSYNFGAGNISVVIRKSNVNYSLVSLLTHSCMRVMCD
jgi:hypothetical protein